MKVYAKDIIQLTKEEVGSSPITEQYNKEEKFNLQEAMGKLSVGDRIRIIDKEGNLYDIILINDDIFGIQEISLKLEYGKMRVFTSLDALEKEVPHACRPQKFLVGRNSKRI
jgi:hypothetical protein